MEQSLLQESDISLYPLPYPRPGTLIIDAISSAPVTVVLQTKIAYMKPVVAIFLDDTGTFSSILSAYRMVYFLLVLLVVWKMLCVINLIALYIELGTEVVCWDHGSRSLSLIHRAHPF